MHKFAEVADAGASAPFSLSTSSRCRTAGCGSASKESWRSTSSSTLERAVEAELSANSHVLLDLSGIDFIDSAGLRAMTAVVRMAKATGRKLRLSADLPGHARRLMEIVGLLPFVPIGVEDPWSDISGPLADPPPA